MSRRTELILHIGLQKTGTTLIQRSMRKLRPALRKKGIVYIDRQEMLEMKSIRGWSAFTHTKPKKRDRFMRDMSQLLEERSKTRVGKPRRILLSNEGLVGTHSPNYRRPFRERAERAISDVVEALEPDTTRLILYVRRQDRLTESAYMQRIHSGKAYTFERYLGRFEDGPIMDFSNLVERLEAIPYIESVTTRPFEIIGAGHIPFVADFLEAAGMRGIDLSNLVDMKKSNPSYTEPAYQAALTLNRLARNKDRKDVRKFLKHLFPVTDYANPVLFSDEERQQYLDLYSETNEAFFRRYHPDIPADVYSSVEATKQLANHLA